MAQDDEVTVESGVSPRTPPYIAYKTFTTFLDELKTNGIPPQIDSSVLKRFSGGIQAQLKMALRALGLVEGFTPTDRLIRLVEAHGTSSYESQLAEILRATYLPVFNLDLTSATPTMFADAFRSMGVKGEDVSRKCRTFFLHAAKVAGIPLGQRILAGSAPRLSNGTAVRRKPKVQKVRENGEEALQDTGKGALVTPPAMTHKQLEYRLIDLMREQDVDTAERDAIWVLIQYLARRPQETTGGDHK